MNIYAFMSESPWLTFFLFWIVGTVVLKCWCRFMRFLNIHKHGWPPEYCDADGSCKDEEKENYNASDNNRETAY